MIKTQSITSYFLISFVSIFSLIVSNAQNVTVNTCSGLSDAQYFIGSTYNSSKISVCDVNHRYDCHGFVIGYFEQGCQPNTSVPFIPPSYYVCDPLTSRDKGSWQNSNKYIKVCNEATANVVWYSVTGSSDSGHSAVNLGNGRYISKYGTDGPLVTHTLNGSWYHYNLSVDNSKTEFWAYIGSNPIQGVSNIIGTASQNYTVNNLPGYTYSWSMVSGGSNVYVSSQSGNTATLSPLYSGSAVLQVTISSGCGSVTQQLALTVQTNTCLEGSYATPSGSNRQLMSGNSISPPSWVNVNLTCPNATSYTWQKTSGPISFYSSGSFASFTLTSGASIGFLVTARNSSNVTLGTRSFSFFNYGSFRAFSNPAATTLKVDVSDEIPLTMTLQALKSKNLKEVKLYDSKVGIDVSELEEDEYVLKVYHEGKLVNEQRVKIAH